MSRKCFVLMPFSDLFDRYYRNILIPAIRDAGYDPIRADEIYGTHPIIDDIFRGIKEAEVLVADVSDKNPNVNYELGIAHTLKRPVIIISQRVEDIPFDYRHLRAIIYDTRQDDWARDLKSKITRTLQEVSANYSPLKIDKEPLNTSLGIKQIYQDRTSVNFLGLVLAMKPESELHILATGLWDLGSSRMQGAIRQKLQENCKVRMLLIEPDSGAVVKRSIEQKWYGSDDYQTHVRNLDNTNRAFISGLSPELRANIELGYFNTPPTHFIFAAGDTMIVGFYLRERPATFSPHLELEVTQGGIYEVFLNHFNSLWATRIEASSNREDRES